MASFWHTANLAFSDKERREFNKWKLEMYRASEKVIDATTILPDDKLSSAVVERAQAMHDKVALIPLLEK